MYVEIIITFIYILFGDNVDKQCFFNMKTTDVKINTTEFFWHAFHEIEKI